MKRVPNYLTFSRLAIVPVFVWLLNDPSEFSIFLAIILFSIAALTDLLDGILARRWGAVSDVGKLLDPLADKLLVMAALVMMLSLRSDLTGEPWVPGWMVFLVLAREMWVTGIRGVAASRGIIVAASSTGKFKSALQMLAIVCLLLHNQKLTLFGTVITYQILGLYLLLVSLVFSYWGAIEYTTMVFRQVGIGLDQYHNSSDHK